VVGVIPPARRCGRDAGFRFDQPLDNPRPTVCKDRAAIDRYCVVSDGSSGARGLGTHLIEGCQAAAIERSDEAVRFRASPGPARRWLAVEAGLSPDQDFVDTPMLARAPLSVARAAAGARARQRWNPRNDTKT
jgi:hypothetical protein